MQSEIMRVYCEWDKEGNCRFCGYKVDLSSADVITRECSAKYPEMPLIYTKHGNPLFIKDSFKNCHIFYIGCGPSILKQDLSFLSSRGICSFAVNNIAANQEPYQKQTIKPNFWCCADIPKSFHDVIWNDPTIMKFVPSSFSDKHFLIDKKENSNKPVVDCPNCFTYRLKSGFNHATFLIEDEACWGSVKGEPDSLGIAGGRSVMFVAIKLIYYLGFKYVYLLGCDFDMEYGGEGKTYAWNQAKHKGGCKLNNDCYEIMNKRFESLLPQFQERGFNIFNCTPGSKLNVFPTLSLERAIKTAKLQFDKKIELSNMYG